MKKFIRLSILLFLITTSIWADEETVVIRSDAWCPYNCEPGSKQEGFMIDLARTALKKHGYKVEYSSLVWARAIKKAREGEFDAIVGAVKSEAPGFVFPKEPLGVSQISIWANKDSKWNFNEFEDLKGLGGKNKIGIIKDYSYRGFDDYIKIYPNSFHIVTGDDALTKMVLMLQKNRLLGLISNNSVFRYHIETLGLSIKDFRIAGANKTMQSRRRLFIALSPHPSRKKRSEIIAAALDMGIAEMRNTGELEAILSQYGVEDWHKKPYLID